MNKTKIVSIVLSVLLLFAFSVTPLLADKHGQSKKSDPKRAILLVAFGTTVPEARKAFDQVESQVKREFPDTEIRWAFTSSIVRKKLVTEGVKLDSPKVALARLIDDGYDRIVVASLHTLFGEEFHNLVQDVNAMNQTSGNSERKIVLAKALMSSRENIESSIKSLIGQAPETRKPQDAILLMGHGSERHPADTVYAAMNYYAQTADPNLFVATVDGQPTLEDMIPKLKKAGVKKVFLMPFMAVAGDHAKKDMCGDDRESWKSILFENGFEVECVLKGTAENPGVVTLWINNIKSAYSHSE